MGGNTTGINAEFSRGKQLKAIRASLFVSDETSDNRLEPK
jgi:hypothetical protein